ncbi:MAG: hypothetical protein ABI600_02640 [Luteolibacter sp.]
MRPSPVTFVPALLACVAACLCSITMLRAQSQEVFVLQNGRVIPAESVKVSPAGFTATLTKGTALDTVNFTAKEVVRATLREPREIAEARILIASEKPDKALDSLTKAEPALLPYQSIPDSWWLRSAILRMDALSVQGKNKEAAAIASSDVLAKLTPEGATLLKDFQQVVTSPGKEAADKIETLRSLTERTIDPWVNARIWLEIGNTLATQGKIEDAVKAWLRVAIFSPAERDLAVRGTILAARGLQQIKCPADGLKLLDDYLSDHLGSPFKETIQIEAAKLKPKSKTTTTPEDSKEPAENTK